MLAGVFYKFADLINSGDPSQLHAGRSQNTEYASSPRQFESSDYIEN